MDPWAVTPTERTKHVGQFKMCSPVGGFVTGEQAKGLFLRSELPAPILGQIWNLADVTCDGKMDINEFSVACKLINMKLKGYEVPAALPPSLKTVVVQVGPGPGSASALLSPINQGRPVPLPGYAFGGMGSLRLATPPSSKTMPVFPTNFNTTPIAATSQIMLPTSPIQPVQGVQRSMSVTSQDLVTSPSMKWAIPDPTRLKYTQQFYQNDRSKSGFLSGVQARNILMGTGLPQQILASVWALSDIDADGRLSTEEFVLAMHLCDVAKQTGRLPPKLPPELVPPSYRGDASRSRRQSGTSVHSTQSAGSTGSNTPMAIDTDLAMSPLSAVSFEDKRKVNYDRGQAELERRRKVLEDMATREREERQRKEREELEKIEKQRLEQERRRQEEYEYQLAVQREAEERRIEALRKSEDQKEAARKEMERQRQQEMEENKRLELLSRLQKEQEEVLRLKGVNHTLSLELSQLGNKVKDMSSKITDTRQGVATVKSDIDGMRSKRDKILNETTMYTGKLKDQNHRIIQTAQEKIRLEKLVTENEVKRIQLKQLREKLQNKRTELGKKQSDANIIATELEELRLSLANLIDSCKSIYVDYQDKRGQVLNMRKKHHTEHDSKSAWSAPMKHAGSFRNKPVYYRALYDFESANQDELSFVVGTIIERDETGNPDPGWLCGILNGRAGWFPESFAEILPSESDAFIPEAIPAKSAPITQAFLDNYDTGTFKEEYYVAAYPYESAEPGDLAFDAGEIILVSQAEGEWWTGAIGSDRFGIFPANFVVKPEPENNNPATSFGTKTELASSQEAEIQQEMRGLNNNIGPSRSPKPVKTKKFEVATVLANYTGNGEGQLNLMRGQLVTVRKQSASGWWEGELQSKGKQREIGWFPGSYVKLVASGSSGVSRQNSTRTTPTPYDELEMPGTAAPVYIDSKEQMVAIFPYTSQNTDELTFVKEDIITVLSKDEPDWWRGQLRDAVGLFPVNYVRPLHQSENQEIQFAIPEAEELNWDGGPGTGAQGPEEPEEDDNENWDSSNDNEEEDESPDQTSLSEPKAQAEGDTTKPFGLDYYEKNYSTSTIPFANPVETQKSTNGVSAGPLEHKRQEAIRELMHTEEVYMKDMNIVESCFIGPLHRSGLLTNEELTTIFVNWLDLIDCSYKLLKAFIIRRKTCDNGVVLMIGDILCQQMPAMMTYIRFCSAQLRAASLIQQKCETSPEFVDFTKKCQADPRTQNMPLSSFLIKPMQRITRYPLLIKKIIECTPENHPDSQNLEEALAKAEELCGQVNEGVREQENSDQLEWMQNHVNCVGLDERLIFNSLTNSLGPRKFLHHGILRKTKSGKELLGVLFNDFLLLAQPTRPMNLTQFSFDRNRHLKFKIYRKPIFLNELTLQEDDTLNEAEFVIGTGKNRMYQMYVCAPGISEKRLWVRSINEAKKRYTQVQQQFLQKQRSKKTSSVGRLLVTVMEANDLCDKSKSVRRRRPQGRLRIVVVEGVALANRDPRGKSDPYCEVSLGSEIRRTTVMKETLNPKWHDSMQFNVKDLHEDILCLTVYDKDEFSPDQFLGRTEIAISTIHEQTRNRKTPWTKTFSLLEIETGEVTIKIHLQIFEK